MRSSFVTLVGLVLAMGCDRTSPTGPTETDPLFAKHEITHLDERTATFELRGLQGYLAAPHATFTRTATAHFIGNGPSLVIKTALHVTINGQGIEKVVVNTAKGPCQAI